jgi:hypothetical protein
MTKHTSRLILTAALVATLATPAMAHEISTIDLAIIVGSQKPCGLKYDQEAIKRFINEHVKADDIDFATSFSTDVQGSEYNLQNLPKDTLALHCLQMRRVAASYGFLAQ